MDEIADIGDTVPMQIDNPSVFGLRFDVSHDAPKLQLVEAENNGLLENAKFAIHHLPLGYRKSSGA